MRFQLTMAKFPDVSQTFDVFTICFPYFSISHMFPIFVHVFNHTFPYFFPYLNPAKQQSLRGNRADRFPKSCHWATHSPAVWWSFKQSPKKGNFPGLKWADTGGYCIYLLYLWLPSEKNHLWLLVIAYSCLIIATPKQRTESGKPGNMPSTGNTLRHLFGT